MKITLRRSSYLLLAVALAILVGISNVIPVNSQQESGNGLSISPTRTEMVVERGSSDTVSIQVKNVSNVDIVAKAFLNDFEADGTTGNPKLIINPDIQSASSIKEFVTGLDDLTIPAGETRSSEISIQVPEAASPGAYYGAVRFVSASADGSTSDAQLSLNASVASLVLIEVPGDITERIEVVDLSAFIDEKEGFFFTRKPNMIGTEVRNLGNGFSKPFGQINVYGPWGTGQIHDFELNNTSPRGNVLPENSRLFKNDLSGVSWPGRYEIVANISHGRGGEILEVKGSFWYVPVWMIAVLAVLLAGIVFGSYKLYKKYTTKSTKRRK